MSLTILIYDKIDEKSGIFLVFDWFAHPIPPMPASMHLFLFHGHHHRYYRIICISSLSLACGENNSYLDRLSHTLLRLHLMGMVVKAF